MDKDADKRIFLGFMKKQDYLIACGLAVLAVFIWLRDTAWMTSLDDTLPILVALPLFVWLMMPWEWRSDPPAYSVNLFAFGVALFSIGIGLNITFLLTVAWAALLSTWLMARLREDRLPDYYKLLPLAVMAFPWVSLDFTRVGWWFRLSGAWVTEALLSRAGFSVLREGTLLNINGLLISIEVACAGLNTLQSMLISGTIVAYTFLSHLPIYWLSFPFLILMAWIANTIRIIVICLLALLISPAFVMGPFHSWSGWGVIMLMFGLCWFVFSWASKRKR